MVAVVNGWRVVKRNAFGVHVSAVECATMLDVTTAVNALGPLMKVGETIIIVSK